MPHSLYRIEALGEPIGNSAADTRRGLLRAVTKQNGGRGAAYCIPNEYICGELARFIRLPVPPVSLVALPGGEPRVASLDFNMDGRPLSPADVDGCLCALPVFSAGVLLFDIWVANPDRHNGNLALDLHPSDPSMHLFDHCHALCGHVAGDALARMKRLSGKLATASCFLASIREDTHFPLWLDRIRATPDFFIETLCEESAPFGLTRAESTAAADFLKSRRNSLSNLIDSHRSAFKALTHWSSAL